MNCIKYHFVVPSIKCLYEIYKQTESIIAKPWSSRTCIGVTFQILILEEIKTRPLVVLVHNRKSNIKVKYYFDLSQYVMVDISLSQCHLKNWVMFKSHRGEYCHLTIHHKWIKIIQCCWRTPYHLEFHTISSKMTKLYLQVIVGHSLVNYLRHCLPSFSVIHFRNKPWAYNPLRKCSLGPCVSMPSFIVIFTLSCKKLSKP